MSEMPKFAWVTKYALTVGIEKLPIKQIEGRMITLDAPDYPNKTRYEHGQDWHLDEESAREQANRMVRRKISSLEKQIVKLRSLSF